jgi:hypothetical protein
MQFRSKDLVCVSREAEDAEEMDKLRKSVVEDVTVGVCGGGWEWQPPGQAVPFKRALCLASV